MVISMRHLRGSLMVLSFAVLIFPLCIHADVGPAPPADFRFVLLYQGAGIKIPSITQGEIVACNRNLCAKRISKLECNKSRCDNYDPPYWTSWMKIRLTF